MKQWYINHIIAALLGVALTIETQAQTLTLAPNPLNVPVNESGEMTVTLSSAAPAGGADVSISSVPGVFVSVPGEVLVLEGETQANFTITGLQPGTETVTAFIGGYLDSAIVHIIEETTPPLLSILHLSTNTIRVSWPAPSTGWNLQQCTDLTTTNWVAPSETTTNNGTEKFIIISPTAGNRFYRLFKP